MNRRFVLVLVAVVLASVAAVRYGRTEGDTAVERQQRGLAQVRNAVGSRLLHPGQAIYDAGGYLQCLTYAANHQMFGLELCFDSSGHLIEAVDRRHGEHIWTLRWARSEAPLRVPPSDIDRAVASVPRAVRQVGLLP